MESSPDQPGDALDQLRDLSEDVNRGWRFVIYCLQKATFEMVDIDDEIYTALELNFWAEHVKLLEREEARRPGISHAIFVRFDEIAAELRAAEQEHFERNLRVQKRKAFVKGLFGLDVEPMDFDDMIQTRRAGDGIADL